MAFLSFSDGIIKKKKLCIVLLRRGATRPGTTNEPIQYSASVCVSVRSTHNVRALYYVYRPMDGVEMFPNDRELKTLTLPSIPQCDY